MNIFLEKLDREIAHYRSEVVNHEAYKNIKSVKDLRIFMQYHLYAVWDFMSLLKALQRNLTCVSNPWFPTEDAKMRHLINEIVAGEESDIDQEGNYISHFELYLKAMEQVGADVSLFMQFANEVKSGTHIANALKVAKAPLAVQNFVNFTFQHIHENQSHVLAAIFTFGREDLIPDMFLSIVKDLANDEDISIFKYYLERHIELDGDEHSHYAKEMLINLCGDDEQKWTTVIDATIASLQQRKALWDGVLNEIKG